MEYKLTYKRFKENLLEGRLLGLRCLDCRTAIVPPKMLCTHCQGPNMEIEELSGEGEILTYTVVRVAAEGFVPPIVVALVRLKDGAQVMGNVVDIDPNKVTMDALMGKKVKVGHRQVEADKYSAGERVALTFHVKGCGQ